MEEILISAYQVTAHVFGAKFSPSYAWFCLLEATQVFGKNFHPCVSDVVFKTFMLKIACQYV